MLGIYIDDKTGMFTFLKKNICGEKCQGSFGQLNLGQTFDELKDLVDQVHFGGVARRQESVERQQRVDEQDGVLASVL
jgi:hypothetical protein